VVALLFDLVRSFILMKISLERNWKGIYVKNRRELLYRLDDYFLCNSPKHRMVKMKKTYRMTSYLENKWWNNIWKEITYKIEENWRKTINIRLACLTGSSFLKIIFKIFMCLFIIKKLINGEHFSVKAKFVWLGF
jgi:hypothetical protein